MFWSFSSICSLLFVFQSLLLTSSATVYQTDFNATWDDDNWRLETTIPDPGHYQSRASIANGYIGISVASLGPFFEVETPVNGDVISGWPLLTRRQTFATVSGFWDSQARQEGNNYPWLDQYGWVSFISGIPHWSGIHVQVNGHILDATTDLNQITNFTSTYDFRNGTTSWKYTWTPPGTAPIVIEYQLFAHRLYINQAATRLTVTPSQNLDITVIDALNGDCAVRSNAVGTGRDEANNVIWSAVSPWNTSFVNAYVYSKLVAQGNHRHEHPQCTESPFFPLGSSNTSSIAQQLQVRVRKGKSATFEKFVGIASSDAFPSQPELVAKYAMGAAANLGFDGMLNAHAKEWKSIMTPDSVDSYHLANGSLPDDKNVQLLQIVAITNPYYILQNTVSSNAVNASTSTALEQNSISVCGLVADCYAGQIYWDVEVWMQPGLVVAHPDAAKQIADYRSQTLSFAKQNIKTAYQGSQNMTHFSDEAAIYPWTSGRYANCTSVGPCWDYEYHINGDIGLELDQYCIATGDIDYCLEHYLAIYNGVAEMYASIVKQNQSTGLYELHNATDPDEFADHVTNPAYTMALIGQHLNRTNTLRQMAGSQEVQAWDDIAKNLAIPYVDNADAQLILEFQGMDASVDVKQADVVLLSDFVDYEDPFVRQDLEFYAGRQSPNGPGMTYSVFSIVASLADLSGCSAYTYQLYASQPYLRAPWFQASEQLNDNFSETGFHPSFPFVTGMGGANQVTVFGYLGYRPHMNAFTINPSMPPQLPVLNYRTIYWQGHAINATSNQTHTMLSRTNLHTTAANKTYFDHPIPVIVGRESNVHNLEWDKPLVLENRRPSLNLTTSGDIAQCHYASSESEILPGQFAISVNDGSRSTKWQPSRSDIFSTLMIDLGQGHVPENISAFKFDWAQNVPMQFNVSFSNSSELSTATQVYRQDSVEVSDPLPMDRSTKLVGYKSNTTVVTLSGENWSGRYVFLSVRGNQAYAGSNKPGASVADFAIIPSRVARTPK